MVIKPQIFILNGEEVTIESSTIDLIKVEAAKKLKRYANDIQLVNLENGEILNEQDAIIPPKIQVVLIEEEEKSGAYWWGVLVSHHQAGDIETVQRAIQEMSQYERQEYREFCILACSSLNEPEILELLLNISKELEHNEPSTPRLDLNHVHVLGYTALCMAAYEGNVIILRMLLDAGCDPNMGLVEGWPPITAATLRGSEEAVSILIEYGADIDSIGNCKTTALCLASHHGHEKIVHKLLENKALIESRDRFGNTALMWASREGHNSIVEKLIKARANVDQEDNYGNTSLCLASIYGRDQCMKLLLAAGASTNKTSRFGVCGLINSVYYGHKSCTKILLDVKANTESQNQDGDTALCIAASLGHEDLVRLLIEYGANHNHRNRNNDTPKMLAAMGSFQELEEFLAGLPLKPVKKNVMNGQSIQQTFKEICPMTMWPQGYTVRSAPLEIRDTGNQEMTMGNEEVHSHIIASSPG